MPHLRRKTQLPNSSAQSPKNVLTFESVFTQTLSDLAVEGGSAHKVAYLSGRSRKLSNHSQDSGNLTHRKKFSSVGRYLPGNI